MTAPVQLDTVVYDQSGLYPGLNPADYKYMNDGNADGAKNSYETGVSSYSTDPSPFIRADLGAVYWIDHVVIGYDYLTNLGADLGQVWGTATLDGAFLTGSPDTLAHNTIITLPAYASTGSANGLVSVPIGDEYQFLRITAAGSWLALLEFEIWVIGGPISAPVEPDMTSVIVNDDWAVCSGERYGPGQTCLVPTPLATDLHVWGSATPAG